MLLVVGRQSYVITFKKAFQQLIFCISMFCTTTSRHFKTSPLSRTCSSSLFSWISRLEGWSLYAGATSLQLYFFFFGMLAQSLIIFHHLIFVSILPFIPHISPCWMNYKMNNIQKIQQGINSSSITYAVII